MKALTISAAVVVIIIAFGTRAILAHCAGMFALIGA